MDVDMRCLICVKGQFFFEETKLKFINKDTYEYIMHMNQVLGGGVCLSVLRILCTTDYFIKYTEFFAIDIIS